MKKIISLMLGVVCIMSLVLSGCQKQEIQPVTIGELLDLIKAEGYANIQHEEGTCDYILVDSGDSTSEDENDIHISLNNIYSNTVDDIVYSVDIEYHLFNDEVEHLFKTIAYKLSNDSEFVEDIIFACKTEKYKTIEKGDLFFNIYTFGEEYVEKNPEVKCYFTTLSVDVDE